MPLRFLCCLACLFATESVSADDVEFVRDIQPILREHCFECHSTGNEEAGLNLGIRQRVQDGSDSGPVLLPGQSNQSLLIKRVADSDPDQRMPPKGSRLATEQVRLLRQGIDKGAYWPDGADVVDPKQDRAAHHWAFQPLRKVTPPKLSSATSTSPIDGFIAQRLLQYGLTAAPPVPSHHLIRRLSLIIAGLPPTPEQIQAFVTAAAHNRDVALQQKLDELLASHHYGER